MIDLIDSSKHPQNAPFLSPNSAQCSILYVEDNPANALLLKTVFKPYKDVTFLTTTTAEEGLEVMRAQHPQIILMDLNLPGMSGLEALAEILADKDLHVTPVIAVTAAVQPHEISAGLQAGFFDYITKPIRFPLLMSALERACSQVSENAEPFVAVG